MEIFNEMFWKKEDKNNLKYARKYVYKAFDKFVQHINNPLETIKSIINKVKFCNLKSQYRPIVWQIFLNIFPYTQPGDWKKIIDDNRSEYLYLKNKHITKEINTFININEEKGSEIYENAKKNLLNEDYDLISLIKIDIDRTFQEIEFYKNKKIKNSLCTILYIYSKQFPNPGYNQGMNDICSILLYVLYQNYILNDSFIKNDETFLYYIIHSNNEFLECDIYTIFKSLMEKDLKIFYSYNQERYRKSFLSQKTIEDKLKLTCEEILNCNDSDIKKRMYKLFYIDLVKIDKKLVKYLHEGEVDPDLFLLRWYLCLFSREFPLENVIYLWDIIFMYEFIEFHYIGNKGFLKGQHLNFIECIALSIFKCLKPKFQKVEEKNQYLDILLHKVNDLDVKLIIQKAITISNTLYGNQIP